MTNDRVILTLGSFDNRLSYMARGLAERAQTVGLSDVGSSRGAKSLTLLNICLYELSCFFMLVLNYPSVHLAIVHHSLKFGSYHHLEMRGRTLVIS